MGKLKCEKMVDIEATYCAFFERLYEDVYDWMNDTSNWHTYEKTNEFDICISEYFNGHASNTDWRYRIIITDNLELVNRVWYNFKNGTSLKTVINAIKNMNGVKILDANRPQDWC